MMQIAPEQGTFMTMLARMIGAQARRRGRHLHRLLVAVHRARSARPTGTLLCCDVSEEWTAIARDATGRRPASTDQIELRIAPGVETLAALPERRVFDLAFIDADKPNYRNYYEALLPRMRPNGVILVDNVLWGGAVIDPEGRRRQHRGDQGLQRLRRRRRARRRRHAPARRRPHPRPQALTRGASARPAPG